MVILGGLDSVGGVIAAGLILGVSEKLALGYLDELHAFRGRLGRCLPLPHHDCRTDDQAPRVVRLEEDREGIAHASTERHLLADLRPRRGPTAYQDEVDLPRRVSGGPLLCRPPLGLELPPYHHVLHGHHHHQCPRTQHPDRQLRAALHGTFRLHDGGRLCGGHFVLQSGAALLGRPAPRWIDSGGGRHLIRTALSAHQGLLP